MELLENYIPLKIVEPKYKLTKNDYKILNDIVKIDYSIISLYRDLICLENVYNSNNNYKYIYGGLIKNIKKEDKLYNNFYINPHIAYAMCKFISDNFSFVDSETYTDEELIFLRIIKRLFDCFLINSSYIDDSLEMFFSEASMECNLDGINIKEKSGLMYYLKYFKDDFDNSYLYFLDEFIKNNDRFSEINSLIINEKYYKLISNKSLEKNYIFNQKKKIDINSSFIYDMGICNKKLCDSITYVYCNFFLIEGISNLLSIENKDYKNCNSVANGIINQAIMRSCLLFMDSENIMEANDSYHEYITNNKDTNINNTNSQKLIINSFKKVKSDKLKRNIIRLKK